MNFMLFSFDPWYGLLHYLVDRGMQQSTFSSSGVEIRRAETTTGKSRLLVQ
jgi:hypothetical protein